MRELRDEEIEFIREDIRRRGVFTESLQEDLLDHLCCYIESQPQDERTFDAIYRQALEAFGQNGLQQVQDETLFLIHHPYLATMKKLMYISGAVASVLLIGGVFFKFHHWPGAGVMLFTSTLLLAVLFAPSLFYLRYKEASEKKDRIISIFALLTAVSLLTGALFKLMHWPGAHVIMMSGFGVFFLIFLPLYLINGFRNPVTRFSALSNGVLLASTGGFLLLLSFQHPTYAEMNTYENIDRNETLLLQQLQTTWQHDSMPDDIRSAMSVFQQRCTAAEALISQHPEDAPGPIGNGPALSVEVVRNVKQLVNNAVTELNAALSKQPGWRPISAPDLHQAMAGDIRFQLIQLRSLAYSAAIAIR